MKIEKIAKTVMGIIPARYSSTRFPAKALADIGGKTMIRRVCEQVAQAALTDWVVATDHELIAEEVRSFGGKVVMTSPDHQTGTSRCWEVFQKNNTKFDFVINIQGDEPFIKPEQINLLIQILQEKEVQIATLCNPINRLEELKNPNTVKLIKDTEANALYFSRLPIPYQRNAPPEKWLETQNYYKHIGIYAFRADIFAQIQNLAASPLETAESLEQLTWLYNGYKIKVGETEWESYGIDTPEDLERVKKIFF